MRQLRQVHAGGAVRCELGSYALGSASEVCAALYGGVSGAELDIQAWRPLDNTAASPACFAVPVARLLTSAGAGRAGSDRLVGLFHSHPGGLAVPSDLDCLGIARLPFVWAIAAAGPGPGAGPGAEPGHPAAATLRFFAWSEHGVREISACT